MTEVSSTTLPRASATSIRAGDVLGGRYRIERQLGVGGMGVVLAATHLELDAPVAIKVIRDEFARNEEVVGRMLFEARAAAKLRSANVVRVLDVARLESGAPYIVMERLEGCDLATLLVQSGTLPVQQVVDYVLQACEGLLEAHSLGIVHRDLKPENLFRAITHEGEIIKVLDFGISKDTGVSPGLSPRSVMTTAGLAVGSPYYMSPEQMRAIDVDVRADIWSLGAILYELLSGHCPFEADSLPVVCARVLNDVEAAPLTALAPQVPADLSATVARCLRKNRDERFENVAELVAALRVHASVDGQRSADRSSRLPVVAPLKPKSDRATATPGPLAASTAVAASFRPASRRYLPQVAGLVVVLCGALAWAVLRQPTEAPKNQTSVVPLVAAAQLATPVTPAATAVSAESSLPAQTGAAPSAEVKREAAAKRANDARAATTSRVKPSPSRIAAPAAKPAVQPSPAAPPTTKPALNAWDPDRMGGRY